MQHARVVGMISVNGEGRSQAAQAQGDKNGVQIYLCWFGEGYSCCKQVQRSL